MSKKQLHNISAWQIDIFKFINYFLCKTKSNQNLNLPES